MSRKSKTLIAALAALVLLSGAYYGSTVWTKRKSDAKVQPFTPSPKLGNLEGSELVRMELLNLTLENEDGIWKLKSVKGALPPAGIELDQMQIMSLIYSLASLWIDSVVDEEPLDLSAYGLDNQYVSRVTITDSAGTQAVYLVGNMTPSRSAYYVMEEGDPKVYAVSAYLVGNMNIPLERIRQKSLFPVFQFPEFISFTMESSGTVIEIMEKPDILRPYLASTYTSHLLTSHYALARGISNDIFSELLSPFNSLGIDDFIDDNPASLERYGLDKPVRIILRTINDTLDLLIGNQVEGKRYAKLTGAPGVFTLRGLESAVSIKPFELIDKFILLVNIDNVDHIEITGGEKILTADIQRYGDEEDFFLNGKKTQDRAFRNFYQSVIGLLADAEYPRGSSADQATGRDNSITIEHFLNTPPGQRVSITLIPYNRDFYAVSQEGATEFLVSRDQVQRIYNMADAMVYE